MTIWALFIIIGLSIFIFLYHQPFYGLFLVIFLAPFTGLTVDLSTVQWLKDLNYINRIQAPASDLLVLLLGTAVVCHLLVNYYKKRASRLHIYIALQQTGFYYLIPFLLAGALSVFNVPHEQIYSSLKYLLRPILFSYLMWLLLPYLLIETEKQYKKILNIVFWTGIITALFAWLPILKDPFNTSLQILVPGGIWGIAPLTYNHNILAEVLVATLPLAFFYFTNPQLENKKVRKSYFAAFVFILITALLTFSRAAWIALFFELIIYFWINNQLQLPSPPTKINKKIFSKEIGFITVALLPFIIYLGIFSFTSVVASSNATRWDMTQIAWTYFSKHPLIGNGIGTFTNLLADTRLFTVEYGDPLDAHGVIQKLIAEEGLAGLITFFIFFVWIFKELFRGLYQAKDTVSRRLETVLFLSVAGSLIFQLFNTSYYSPHLWLPLGLAVVGKKIYSYAG